MGIFFHLVDEVSGVELSSIVKGESIFDFGYGVELGFIVGGVDLDGLVVVLGLEIGGG